MSKEQLAIVPIFSSSPNAVSNIPLVANSVESYTAVNREDHHEPSVFNQQDVLLYDSSRGFSVIYQPKTKTIRLIHEDPSLTRTRRRSLPPPPSTPSPSPTPPSSPPSPPPLFTEFSLASLKPCPITLLYTLLLSN
eukprot:TRINITY_DN3019_c0_g2_i1.p1 TRINITY_DN3019_c0_g2~~TRINITY_DN3019_c0_g2_i1.p1  ORF type:complete len:136 (-),score=16.74 TRINITY_DN3019_c0_g2_i1:78-485(-)